MKIFKNQLTTVNVPDMEKSTKHNLEFKQATYADLALIVVRAPKQGGFAVEDMRQRFRLIDELDKVGPKGSIEFEDADASLLQSLVAEFKWDAMDKEIIDFSDYVAELEKVKK